MLTVAEPRRLSRLWPEAFDPHHLRFMQARALGRKVSEEFAVPLCRGHHREAHRARDERAWWTRAGIDPISVARKLWKQSRHTGRRMRISDSDHTYGAESKIT